MIAFLPIAGGHIRLAERFVNPAFSFAMGWNYWYNWTIVGMFGLFFFKVLGLTASPAPGEILAFFCCYGSS